MARLFCVLLLVLTSCSAWNEDFEGAVVRGHPEASIHKINTMADQGLFNHDTDENVLRGNADAKVFQDGSVSRGGEDVRRMYMMTYEDRSENLHIAHYLYLVVSPSTWIVSGHEAIGQ